MSRACWTACAAAALLLAAGCGHSTRTADETAAPPAAEPDDTAPMSAASPQQTTDSPCDAQPHSHVIVVAAGGVSCKEPHVSKGAGNQITWRSASGENIEVVFNAKGGVNPFPALTCPGSGPVCNSGAINSAASGRYDYDVWLYTGGGKTPIDPGVIIDP